MPSGLKTRLQWLWQYSCVTAVTVGLLFVLQWPDGFLDPDSFYHARLVTWLIQHGVPQQFLWLPFTVLAEHFTDHHLIYHLWLMPWVAWLGPSLGVKLGHSGLVLGLIWLFVAITRHYSKRYGYLAVLWLLTLGPFILRLNLIKAGPLALLWLLAGWLALQRRQYWAAGLFAGVYVWSHGGFIMALVLAVCWWVGDSLAQSWQQRRMYLGNPLPIFAVGSGIILGVIINPFFPNNLWFYWQQLVQIGVVNYASIIDVGAEWYPYQFSDFVGATSLTLLSLLLASVVGIRHYRAKLLTASNLGLVGFMLVCLLATMRSRRFIEYFIPVAWLWCCTILLPYLEARSWQQDWGKIQQHFGRWSKGLMALVVIMTILSAGLSSYRTITTFQQDVFPLNYWAGAGEFMATHTAKNSLVFHASWSDFPALYYHDTHNTYVAGLDATFFYLQDPQLYWRWRDISSGKAKDHLSTIIPQEFGATTVVIDRQAPNQILFQAYLLRDPQAELVYEDSVSRVFRLKP